MKSEYWLRHYYWDIRKTLKQMGEMCGVDGKTIQRWMKKFNIPRRTNSEANSFELNHEWKGNNAKKVSIHQSIRRHKKEPNECPKCGGKIKLELSFDHSKGNYTRNLEDYKYLCHSCHMKRDWANGDLRERNERGQFI